MMSKLLYVSLSALVGMGVVAQQPAQAAVTSISSLDACFDDQNSLSGLSLSASGRCLGTGATAEVRADLGGGQLGASASSAHSPADALALFATDIYFYPNQIVPLTVTMEFKGSILGGPGSGPLYNQFLFEAVVDNGAQYGVRGYDTKNGFTTLFNSAAYPGQDVYESGVASREDIDLTLTESWSYDIGASGDTVSIGGHIEAQAYPAFAGAATTVDFYDPATVSFSVPAGTRYRSEGFLEANPSAIPEASTWASILLGFTALGLGGYRRQKAGRGGHAA
jgi:hypothetical protein